MNCTSPMRRPAVSDSSSQRTCLIRTAATQGDETDDVERPDRAAPAAAIDELVAGALVRRVPPTGAPVEERGRRGHHLAAVRLLDRVGVLEPFLERQLRGPGVHDPRGHDREVAIAGHADRLEPGFARLARGAHAVGEARLVAAVDDVDPGQGQVGLQDRLTVADRFGQLSRRLGIRTGRRELRGEQSIVRPHAQQERPERARAPWLSGRSAISSSARFVNARDLRVRSPVARRLDRHRDEHPRGIERPPRQLIELPRPRGGRRGVLVPLDRRGGVGEALVELGLLADRARPAACCRSLAGRARTPRAGPRCGLPLRRPVTAARNACDRRPARS